LQVFDTAVVVARKAGIEAPAEWPRKPGSDAFEAKVAELKLKATNAQSEKARAAFATEAAAAIEDVLNAIAQRRNTSASSVPPTEAEKIAPQPSKKVLLEWPFWSDKLPLYLASLSMLVSLVALWRGWFLARRAINKALTDAGLL
jgi:hypothetical protein